MSGSTEDLEMGRRHELPVSGQSTGRSPSAVRARRERPPLLWGILKPLGEIIHFGLTTLFVFALAYVLGRVVLTGPVGNDSLLHIANAEWFDRFLPHIPNWFPLQGAGISLQRSYSILPYIVVSAVRRMADISLVQAYRLVSFVSVPAAALSVYLFCRTVVKSRTVGFVGAVLFLLSPISWSWIFIQGYLATTVAVVTLPLTLLCFYQYLACEFAEQGGAARRAWLVALILSFSFTVLAHVVVGAAAIAGMAFYVLSLAAVSERGRRFAALITGVRSLVLCGLLAGLVLAFWAVPLATYTRATNPHGESRLAESSILQPSLAELFSVKPLDAQDWGWYLDSSLPVVVGLLFVLGAAAGAFSSRKVLAIAIAGSAAIGYILIPDIAINLNKIFAMSSAIISVRSLAILASVLFPVVAAYGASALPLGLAATFGYVGGHKRSSGSAGSGLASFMKGSFVSITTLLVAGTALYLLRTVSIDADNRVNYGLSRSGMDILDIWGTGIPRESVPAQLALDAWPPFAIADSDPKIDEVSRVAFLLPSDERLRMDVSPYLGMYAQSLAVESGASQINTYIWPANLMWSIWGYQQKVMFIDSPPENEFGTPITLNEVSDWFGTEYVYLNPAEDRTDIYDKAGWTRIVQEDYIELWQYPSAPGLATLSTRPRVLVISSDLLGAYEMVFHAANRGAIPYQMAYLIKGGQRVDEYTFEELRDFDALFLEGYSYRDSKLAWELLDEYVSQGGSLFVDTGWQWGVPEWEFDTAPPVLPVERLKWSASGTSTEYRLESPELAIGVEPLEFAPLTWNGGPWGVSVPTREQIRPWGDIVLSANGQPLIVAGRHGEGRVVWSGMNLVAHSGQKNNEAEIELLNNLVEWLLAATPPYDLHVEYSRDHPDRVEFVMDLPAGERATLLWREAYYPAWHAYLLVDHERSRELPIHKGGPGFMLVPIEGAQGVSVVELVWETPLIERLATAVSILTSLALGLFLIDGVAANGVIFDRIAHRFKSRSKRPKPRGSVEWLTDAGGNDAEDVR